MGHVIYEKTYPPIEWEKAVIQSGNCQPVPAFDAFYEKIMEVPEVCLIPERIASSKIFIETAIEISVLYQLDTKIIRHYNRITVDYSFYCGGGMTYIGQVLGMADEFAFFTGIRGKDITISMDYYTHTAV